MTKTEWHFFHWSNDNSYSIERPITIGDSRDAECAVTGTQADCEQWLDDTFGPSNWRLEPAEVTELMWPGYDTTESIVWANQ